MILYYAPTACSMAPHIALEEAGLEFEARRLDLATSEQLSAAYLEINPQGRVPVLVVDGTTVTEVPALLTYIASLQPNVALVPPAGTLAFARCFEWLGWLSSTLHVTYAQFRRPTRFVPPESSCIDEVSAHGRDNTLLAYREVERRLGSPWAIGEQYSIADMYLFPFYTWAWRLDLDIEAECPKWAAWMERMKQRPAVQRAMERENSPVAA